MNEDRVTAFDYYDGLNSARVQNVKDIEMDKYKNLKTVAATMKKIEDGVVQADNILRFFEQKWDEYKEKKKEIKQDYIRKITEMNMGNE